MTVDSTAELLRAVASLNVHSRGGARSPHKPLLLLLALSRLQQDQPGSADFAVWEEGLAPLLVEYSPSGRTNAHYPFRRLVGDGLWSIESLDDLPAQAFTARGDDFSVSWLRQHSPPAGLPVPVHDLLAGDDLLVDQVVRLVLHRHFPPSVWADVVADVGLAHDLSSLVPFPGGLLELSAPSRSRSASFPGEVMEADGRTCVVCGYDGRDAFVGRPVGLDAVHVRWWTHDGPDDLANGLAMCALHHRLFDRGMFGFDADTRALRASPRFAATALTPVMPNAAAPQRIASAHLRWQMANVFRAA